MVQPISMHGRPDANSQAFFDVTLGNNGIDGTIAGYPATQGWDPCKGLGTPIGTALLRALDR